MDNLKLEKNLITPLYDSVKDYVDKLPARFHMPSHKGKRLASLYSGSEFDITELDFSDNLLSANGVILESEALLAEFYGVDRAFMCTSGATTGLFSALYVAKLKGKKIILSKNSHKSVYNALSVLNLEPCFIEVEYDEYGLPLPVSSAQIAQAIKDYPEAESVLITTPDYFGRVSDVQKISEICKDKLLIADSAHGAHFAFDDSLSERAELYADICVLSMHKTLPCFTGSALILCKESYAEQVKKGRETFHTSSPYYPSMISMDYARAHVSNKAFPELKKLLDSLGFSRIPTYDYTKLILRGGDKLDSYLKERGIYPECVFGNYVLLIVVPWDKEELLRMKKALDGFNYEELDNREIQIFPKGERVLSFNEVTDKPCVYIPIEESAGRITLGEVGLYPPGVPVLIRGELIDENRLKILLKNKKSLFGVDSGRVCVLK